MKKLLLVTIIFLCLGCSSKKGELKYTCNGNKSTIEIKKGTTFKCELLNTKYTFKIKSISNDKLVLSASDIGLSKQTDEGTISLLEKESEFEIEKGKEVKLVTQSMDYNEYLILNWK